jgi:hypothetical protein
MLFFFMMIHIRIGTTVGPSLGQEQTDSSDEGKGS